MLALLLHVAPKELVCKSHKYKQMEININKLKFVVKKVTDTKKHQNLLAYVTLAFRGESGEHFAISGFTLWKSKFGGYNVEMPGKRGFKYCLIEQSLMRKIDQEIIEEYEYGEIPIVEDK